MLGEKGGNDRDEFLLDWQVEALAAGICADVALVSCAAEPGLKRAELTM
jgi:hypothetical protein